MGDLVITWSPYGFAVSYKVDVEHQVSHERDSQTTSNTTVTFYNKPTGVYNYRVTAIFSDDSTQVIVEDIIEL